MTGWHIQLYHDNNIAMEWFIDNQLPEAVVHTLMQQLLLKRYSDRKLILAVLGDEELPAISSNTQCRSCSKDGWTITAERIEPCPNAYH